MKIDPVKDWRGLSAEYIRAVQSERFWMSQITLLSGSLVFWIGIALVVFRAAWGGGVAVAVIGLFLIAATARHLRTHAAACRELERRHDATVRRLISS